MNHVKLKKKNSNPRLAGSKQTLHIFYKSELFSNVSLSDRQNPTSVYLCFLFSFVQAVISRLLHQQS